MPPEGWEKRLDWILRTVPFWHQQPGIEDWDGPTGEPRGDVMLQTVDEFVGLCEFFAKHDIRSYMEIGIWTGRLISSLDYIFQFDRKYAIDILYPSKERHLPIHLPNETILFVGSSVSLAAQQWRQQLGHIDFVMIDGDHTYKGVKMDFEMQSLHPHRFLGFHDLVEYWSEKYGAATGANPDDCGVKQLWSELVGEKVEIIRPVRELGLDFPLLGIGILSSGH